MPRNLFVVCRCILIFVDCHIHDYATYLVSGGFDLVDIPVIVIFERDVGFVNCRASLSVGGGIFGVVDCQTCASIG